MSRIETLISELCENGVKYVALAELGNFYGGLTGKGKSDFVDGNCKFITYKNIYSNSALDLNICDYVKVQDNERQNAVKYGDVLFTGSSETADECGMSSVVMQQVDERIYVNSFCFIFRFNNFDIMLPGFAKHLFRSKTIREQIKKTASGVTRYNVSKKLMQKIKIPIPPLSVQQEIVRILDGFSELEKELEKELVARRKQYEYYRNQLVSFGEGGNNACDVKWMKLGEVVKIQNGFAFKSTLFKNHGVPVLRITNIQSSGVVAENLIFVDTSDYTVNFENFKVFPGDVVVALSGATTGKSAKNKTNLTYLLNQRVAKFIPNENMLLNSYLYHWTKSKENEFLQMAGGGAQPNLSTEQMKIMEIPIPPIAEQERIVAILDKFDALVNDISVGLPAELKARRKQYEYWRNKLLSFEEVA